MDIENLLIKNPADLESMREYCFKQQQSKTANVKPDFKYVKHQYSVQFQQFVNDNRLHDAASAMTSLTQSNNSEDLLFVHTVDVYNNLAFIKIYALATGQFLNESNYRLGLKASVGDFAAVGIRLTIPTYYKDFDGKEETGEKSIIFYTLPLSRQTWS
jgi:hypothetical protein